MSLPDKPVGMGVGATACSGGCCIIQAPRSRVSPEGIGLKGVIIIWEISSVESDRPEMGLGLPCLRRRRTKTTTPITESMAAATPPMTPPAIAGGFDFACDESDDFVVVVPLGFMLSTGALREGPTVSHQRDEALWTNFRANGAYTAPWAGLITIIAISVDIRDTNAQLTHLATPETPPSIVPLAKVGTGNAPPLVL